MLAHIGIGQRMQILQPVGNVVDLLKGVAHALQGRQLHEHLRDELHLFEVDHSWADKRVIAELHLRNVLQHDRCVCARAYRHPRSEPRESRTPYGSAARGERERTEARNEGRGRGVDHMAQVAKVVEWRSELFHVLLDLERGLGKQLPGALEARDVGMLQSHDDRHHTREVAQFQAFLCTTMR